LVDARIHSDSDVARRTGLVDARVPSDVTRRTGLIDARIHPDSDVARRTGLVDARIPPDVTRRARLVDARVTPGVRRTGQRDDHRTDNYSGQHDMRCSGQQLGSIVLHVFSPF
jgi:hypothetical protein